jgi:hypothetical protein
VIFVESPVFSRLLVDYLTDEQYGQLQSHLIANPGAGDVIKGSGGVRKVRWRGRGKGKSGGLRVIYYWPLAAEQIFMLTLYAKSEKADLSASDLRKIVKLVKEMEND